MTNNSNIYDIDGEILREAGDTSELSVEEAQTRLEKYKEKAQKLDENDPKLKVYTTYIHNLQKYIFNYYLLHPQEGILKAKSVEQQVKDAMEELKNDVENDEYVDFEEVKDGEGTA